MGQWAGAVRQRRGRVSRQQAEALEVLLRDGPLDLGGDLAEQRPLLDQLMTSHPLPPGVRASSASLGALQVIDIAPPETDSAGVLLYFHGGAYALGSALGGAGLASEIVALTGVRAISVEYRLAPEHPHPAALEDALEAYRALLASGVSASEIIVAGESAGGGLVLALLLVIKEHALPMPSSIVVFSPWADLSLSGSTLSSKAAVDPALTAAALRTRAADYVGDADPALSSISPVFGDYRGLPPLLIQVGSHEILLDDALRVAAAAAIADVAVTLEVTPNVPHVFQGFAADLDQGRAALRSAATFIRTHLTNSKG